MKSVLIGLAGLLLSIVPALAQISAPATTPAAGTAYTGPCYPGGPDSLRALLRRCTRPAVGVSGRAFVRLEFDSLGRPVRYGLLTPPSAPSAALDQATQAAAQFLRAHMPTWQLPPPDAAVTRKEPRAETLLLEFGADPAQEPWPYADVEPTFATLEASLPERSRQFLVKTGFKPFGKMPQALTAFVQMQVLYPPAALRNGEQGRGYAYLEVSETGAIEHLAIIGTLSRSLDAEMLRALRRIPPATSPALQQGRPVRVYYVLPLTFKIQ